jgi:hypothetical protein
VTPIRPRDPGSPRFPGFDALSQRGTWDPVTAGVVLSRVGPLPPLRFFSPHQEAIARPLLDVILDQHAEPRVPVLEMIDQRLAELSTDGWRYDDLPPDPEAWCRSLEALDQQAHDEYGTGYAACNHEQRVSMLKAFLALDDQDWHGMPADQVWSLWYRYACAAYYSHPSAWSEIGFPGPAYPRGYKSLGTDGLEPHETPDHLPPDMAHRQGRNAP